MEIVKELINFGALGLIVYWFMYKFTPQMKELTGAITEASQNTTRAINRQSQLLLLNISGAKPAPARSKGPALDELLTRLAKELDREDESDQAARKSA